MGEKLTIKDCTKNYGISEITLRRWIKRGKLSAELINGQYLIDSDEIESILSREKEEQDEVDPILDSLKRENESLSMRIKELEREIEFQRSIITRLEEDKSFLQGQIQQLTNTINMLTMKQLPPPGFFNRIKNLFKKES